jgi:2-polyprenyl-3-methyl-5-hydroxy-6-metoxy-1,4-benzoquinol methylase
MNQDENKQYWENRAEKNEGHLVSWWDINMKKIEISTISGLISSDDYVLDVGCSNGSTTVELQKNTGASFLGIDCSEKAILQANKFKNDRLDFIHKNILEYAGLNLFDKVISIRCLINLMQSSNQLKALERIHSALKPGGFYIMCEAFTGGSNNLNQARHFFGLEPLPMPKHNKYLDEQELQKNISGMFSIEKVINHGSLYYIGTRVFQYLSLDTEPKESDTELHKFFANFGYQTRHSGDFSPNKVYVLKKTEKV